MKVFVTGATGFVGRAVVARLVVRGDSVVALTRSAKRAGFGRGGDGDQGVEVVEGESEFAGAWQARVSGCDAVINLAGESLAAKRWDARQKQIIHDSRVETTRRVVEAIAAAPSGSRPTVLVSVSAVDYYPFSVDLGAALAVDEDDEVTESCPPADSFLSRVCRNWEREAKAAEPLGVRVVLPRLGVVLGPGGALAKMAGPFKFFVGGRLGHGRQWFSWVHLEDVVGVIVTALDNEAYTGPVNVVAPQAVRNREFAKTLGSVLGRPAWARVPGRVLKAMVGEFAEHLLEGRRVIPHKLEALGYTFVHPTLRGALEASLRK